jgi:hypothetical protein
MIERWSSNRLLHSPVAADGIITLLDVGNLLGYFGASPLLMPWPYERCRITVFVAQILPSS